MRQVTFSFAIVSVIALQMGSWGCKRIPIGSAPDSAFYVIVEGKGIESVGCIGDDIDNVFTQWGKPDREKSAEWAFLFPDKFYSYNQRGVELSSSWGGEIEEISFFCNTGDTSTFYQTGLVWLNPSSQYKTFRGKTSQGLVLRDSLTLGEVYEVYGKPSTTIKAGEINFDKLSSKDEAFAFDMGAAGYSIYYPQSGISFHTFDNLVERISISKLE